MGRESLSFVKGAMVGIVAGLMLAAIVCAWVAVKPSPPSVAAKPARELAGETPQRLECKPVVVYRDRIKKELGLPDVVRHDPAKHIADARRIPADDHPRTASAVYDEGSGKVEIFVRRDPLPWLAFDHRYSLGIYYGARDDLGGVWRVAGDVELIQIKLLRGVVHAQVDDDGRRFAGVGVKASW